MITFLKTTVGRPRGEFQQELLSGSSLQRPFRCMSVSLVGAKLWNELDSNLRNTKTILLFKKNQMGCRTYYRHMYHMFEYLRFEKRCSTLNIMAKLI